MKQYLPDTPSYLELCFHKYMWESLESHQRGDFSEQPQHIERWKMWAAPRKNGSLGHMGTVKIQISLTLKGLLLYIDIPYSTSASVAQLDAPSDWRPGGCAFNPRRGRQHLFVEIDHEIFSTVILSLPLIQEGQLSVSGERMCTVLVNRLED